METITNVIVDIINADETDELIEMMKNDCCETFNDEDTGFSLTKVFLEPFFNKLHSKTLIVTTSTAAKHQNEYEDGDGDAGLCHVAVQVDDVTP